MNRVESAWQAQRDPRRVGPVEEPRRQAALLSVGASDSVDGSVTTTARPHRGHRVVVTNDMCPDHWV
jgi:hypothetical protein